MQTQKGRKFKKIINKVIDKGSKSEAVILIENAAGDISFSFKQDKRELSSPLFMASITKMFTATCIVKLLEQEKLSLQNKISKYIDFHLLQGMHVYNKKDYSPEITISDLLFQTSGLPDIYEEGKNCLKKRFIKEDFSISFEEIIKQTKELKPHFIPHSAPKAYYSDINYELLGKIIEKVTSTSLQDVYKSYIFTPLGLKDTYIYSKKSDFLPGICYKNQVLKRPRMVKSFSASGGCVTTPKELMIFVKAFFGGRLFDIKLFSKLSNYSKLQTSMSPICYGGGYMQIPLNGITTLFMGKGELVGHSGSTGSFAFYYPEKDLYFVGNINQMANPTLPIKLIIKLALAAK